MEIFFNEEGDRQYGSSRYRVFLIDAIGDKYIVSIKYRTDGTSAADNYWLSKKYFEPVIGEDFSLELAL